MHRCKKNVQEII